MWAPADIFTPTVNAIALAMKRTFTLLWNDWLGVLLVTAVVILVVVALAQIRRRPRR